MVIDFSDFRVVSFDCYGTLIDWETGIVGALQPLLERHGARLDAERILQTYAGLESSIESDGFVPYRQVLREVVRRFAAGSGFELDPGEEDVLVDSIGEWPPFPDTVPALKALRNHARMAVVSNVDDELFARTAERLGVELDWVVTAEQVGAYKPSRAVFDAALERFGHPVGEVLHVAQSPFHDIAPAGDVGLATVWVNRRAGRPGTGATPPAEAEPDVEVPDLLTLVAAFR